MSPTARFLRSGVGRFCVYGVVVVAFLFVPPFRDLVALLGLYVIYCQLKTG